MLDIYLTDSYTISQMDIKFKNVGLIGKLNISNVAETLLALIDLLNKYKINIFLEQETAKTIPQIKLPIVSTLEFKNKIDILIIVGGDGSLLSASHFAAPQNVPVLGINKGRLGFLTDILPDKIDKIIPILAGDYYEERRFLLKADGNTKENIALNDIVLLSSNGGHMVEFSLYIDDQYVSTYHADGLITSTPTGSTAHALAGGGPILHPQSEVIVLVPMLSYNLSSRAIVVKNTSKITLNIAATNKKNEHTVDLGRRQDKILLSPGNI